MKTYVFIAFEPGGEKFIAAYGDLYEIINDLYDNFAPGNYSVYETDLMPDQVLDTKKLRMENKLKYVTMYTKNPGA